MYLERDELPPHWDREILFNMGEESTTESSESEEIDDDDDDESPEDKDHLVRKIKFIFELKFSLLLPNLQMKTKQWNVDNLNLFVLASNSAHIFKNHSQCSGCYCDAHQTTTRKIELIPRFKYFCLLVKGQRNSDYFSCNYLITDLLITKQVSGQCFNIIVITIWKENDLATKLKQIFFQGCRTLQAHGRPWSPHQPHPNDWRTWGGPVPSLQDRLQVGRPSKSHEQEYVAASGEETGIWNGLVHQSGK